MILKKDTLKNLKVINGKCYVHDETDVNFNFRRDIMNWDF